MLRKVSLIEMVPFRVGNYYQTLNGDWVLFCKIYAAGTEYETMEDQFGVHRYTSRDFGRVTGTDWENPDPRNTPPLWRVVT